MDELDAKKVQGGEDCRNRRQWLLALLEGEHDQEVAETCA